MALLCARLFGGFELTDSNGAEVKLSTRKARALLAFLIIEADRSHTRDRLASLLWSDRQQAQARHSLTQAIGAIRKLGETIGVQLVSADPERVGLLEESVDADILRFRKVAKKDPTAAADLYVGPLLDGFSAPDKAFEEWLSSTRSEFHSAASTVLIKATDQAEAAGAVETAIATAKRWLDLDRYSEPAHRRLMALFLASGDRARAILQYETCAQALRDELGVEPSAETRALLETIRSQSSGSSALERTTYQKPSRKIDRAEIEDRPSIAIMPFDSLSEGPGQNYFADGIADDVITALSKLSRMRVIARNSTFALKGRSTDLQTLADQLGARYVLEGSVQRRGSRLRVSAQLIDTRDNINLWAERYDRTTEDLFDIQDEITKEIVTALRVKLTDGEDARVLSRGTNNIDAWQLCVRANELYLRFNATDFLEARTLAERALEHDPNYAYAWALLGLTYWYDSRLGYTSEPEEKIRRAGECAERAFSLDDTLSPVITLRSHLAGIRGEIDEGVAIARRGFQLHPGNADVRGMLGFALIRAGKYTEAASHLRAAMSLNPLHPNWYRNGLAKALLVLGELEEAQELLNKTLQTEPRNLVARILLAYIYDINGQTSDARQIVDELSQIAPDIRLGHVPRILMIDDIDAAARIVERLHSVGFPQ